MSSQAASASHHGPHGHSHGLVADEIKRSREGIRVVAVALAVLAATAAAQVVIYLLSGSVALLADLLHNTGDALTAIPLAIAFLLRSARAERIAGLLVVLAIFVSAVTAGVFAVERLINPVTPDHLGALALAGLAGVIGNEVAARIRLRGGRRIDSPALIADGYHARTDGLVSAGVVVSAAAIWAGAPIVDPLVGLAICGLILKVTWDSWRTIQGHDHSH